MVRDFGDIPACIEGTVECELMDPCTLTASLIEESSLILLKGCEHSSSRSTEFEAVSKFWSHVSFDDCGSLVVINVIATKAVLDFFKPIFEFFTTVSHMCVYRGTNFISKVGVDICYRDYIPEQRNGFRRGYIEVHYFSLVSAKIDFHPGDITPVF